MTISIEKRFSANCFLALNEKRLRDKAKSGMRLYYIKRGIFRDTYCFIKCAPCNNVYFSAAVFKSDSLSNTSYGVIRYIKNKYHGKELVGNGSTIRLKKENITDIDDVKRNLLYREKCIRNDYLLYFSILAALTLAFSILGIISGAPPPFYLFPAMFGLPSAILVIALFIHFICCKKVYQNFLQ